MSESEAAACEQACEAGRGAGVWRADGADDEPVQRRLIWGGKRGGVGRGVVGRAPREANDLREHTMNHGSGSASGVLLLTGAWGCGAAKCQRSV